MEYETLASLGEAESLKRTIAHLKPGDHTLLGSGDDAAVVKAEGSFLVSTDTLVEGHDFKTTWSTGFDLGFKAVATNLADIAAMGGKPTALVVAMVVPKQTKVSWLEDFAKGLQAAIDRLAPGCEVVGGDLASGSEIVIAVTVHGQVHSSPVTRSGAKPGDIIAVAGKLGFAACGLALLQSNQEDLIRSYDDWVIAQLRPVPPIAEGALAAEAGASSMLDVSDSLSLDLARLAGKSNVTMAIDSKELKGFEATLDLPAQALGFEPMNWVLYGGEDHALLATFPKEATLPRAFKPIGQVRAKSDSEVLLDEIPLAARGWDSILGDES